MKEKVTITSRFAMAGLGVVTLCLLTPLHAASKPGSSNTLSSADKSFVKKAAKGGQLEVAWGRVAAEKGNHADVKKFGNRMVNDHSKANDDLKALAARKGIDLPEAKANPNWKSDKAYMDMMVKDHEKDVAEFHDEAKNGTDPDVKKFAEKTVKTLEKHLHRAKQVQAELK